jgi:hypothetical protein
MMQVFLILIYFYGIWNILFKQGPRIRSGLVNVRIQERDLMRGFTDTNSNKKDLFTLHVKSKHNQLFYGTQLRIVITAVLWPIVMVISVTYLIFLILRERKIRDG